ncbi:CG2 omega domain protein [Vibrio hangzhouensis]|uniref:CG2 omega domain-containing protein n=1 Tax=Vibrio hangzhouensis TaxID=462991 RepID=A0A1H5YKF5_9VIBR|nr:CG2 omega domain protein [Vibrio hangzhouensis]SEG24210.1 hypothetical protein SAMN04488244_109126 [Vibrio hangzhouensis]
MRKLVLVPICCLLPLSTAYADLTIKSDRMEISEDCRQIEGDKMTLRSEDCESSDKGKDKGNGENRSVHGDNNPGKGHDKSKKGKKDDE